MSALTAICSSQYWFIQTHGYGEDNVCIPAAFHCECPRNWTSCW